MAEIAHKSRRSVFASFQAVAVGFGSLLSYWCGYMTDWRWLSAAMSITSLVAAASMAVLPESPYWLVSRERIGDAR